MEDDRLEGRGRVQESRGMADTRAKEIEDVRAEGNGGQEIRKEWRTRSKETEAADGERNGGS